MKINESLYNKNKYIELVETNHKEHIYTLTFRENHIHGDWIFLTRDNLKELKKYIDAELEK